MKRYILTICLFFVAILGYSEAPITYCKYDGQKWGEWATTTFTYIKSEYVYLMKGFYDDFVIYSKYENNTNYVLRVKIDSMQVETDKSKIKARRKSKEWYVYKGTVEYISAKGEPFDLASWPKGLTKESGFAHESHTVEATIKVAPYDRFPEFYNILFDHIGIGVCVH